MAGTAVLIRDVRDLRNGDLLATQGTRMDEELARHIVIGQLRGQILREDIVDPKTGETIAEERTLRSPARWQNRLLSLPLKTINIRPTVTNEVHYLPADEEDKFIVAQANAKVDENNRFVRGNVVVPLRRGLPGRTG